MPVAVVDVVDFGSSFVDRAALVVDSGLPFELAMIGGLQSGVGRCRRSS